MLGNSEQENEQHEHQRGDLDRVLNGFTKQTCAMSCYWDLAEVRLQRDDFPVPEMLLLIFRNFLGWNWTGAGEKVRWSVFGSFGGEAIAFELRKFGLTMLRPRSLSLSDERICGQLKSAVNVAEKLLKPMIKHQISAGCVTIANHASEFMSRYQFLRAQADKSYRRAARQAKSKAKPQQGEDSTAGIFTAIFSSYALHMEAQKEGFYYSEAMVDAYFSALEHRSILLRAFTGIPLPENGFQAFMAKPWNQKLNELVGPHVSAETRKTLKDIQNIKERIRNPFAHGGYENDKGALHVHIPTIGTIPGNITKFGKGVRFSMIPIEANDHKESCGVFDRVDNLLCSAHLARPHRLIEAGVDPSFDEDTLHSYRDATAGSEEELDAFIDHWGTVWEMHANMDY